MISFCNPGTTFTPTTTESLDLAKSSSVLSSFSLILKDKSTFAALSFSAIAVSISLVFAFNFASKSDNSLVLIITCSVSASTCSAYTATSDVTFDKATVAADIDFAALVAASNTVCFGSIYSPK